MSTIISIPPSAVFPYIDVKKDYGAVGDGSTDDRAAIKSAIAALVSAGGGELFFPPGTYKVTRDGSTAWCLDLNASNVTVRGIKGQSILQTAAGLPNAGITCLHIDNQSNVSIRDLGVDGNWGNVVTTVAAASHAASLPVSTLNVVSTTGFPSSGTVTVVTSTGTAQVITYTGVTSTSFTGCTGGTGILIQGGNVGYSNSQAGINHTTQADPKSHGIMIRGCTNTQIDNVIVRNCYGDGIWNGASGLVGGQTESRNTRITNTTIDMCARDGVSIGQPVNGLYLYNVIVTNIITQAFDCEPIGALGYARDVTLDSCVFGNWWDTTRAGANSSIGVQGGSTEVPNESNRARKFRIRDCTVYGDILISDAVDVICERNRIIMWNPQASAYSPVYVEMDCDDIWVLDNYIYYAMQDSGGNGAAAIHVRSYVGGTQNEQPAGVHVRGNRIHARNGRHGIRIDGTGQLAYSTGAQMPNEAGTSTATSGAISALDSSMNLLALPQSNITVASTTGFASSGTFFISTHSGVAIVSYTGISGNTFTGCTTTYTYTLHTSDVVSQAILTDSTKSWIPDQWIGKILRSGGFQGAILTNTATQIVLDTGGWRTLLGIPLDIGLTPSTGAYTIYGTPAMVVVEGNMIDCFNDGVGGGGNGIVVSAGRAGMRCRVKDNEIIAANSDGIQVVTVDANREILHLELIDNVIEDNQAVSTTVNGIAFRNSGTALANPIVDKLFIRGNHVGSVAGSNTPIIPVAGLTTGMWLIADGPIQEWAGYGSPETALVAPPGSLYHRLDGGSNTSTYFKESGTSNTGWAAAASASPQAPLWMDELRLLGGNYDPIAVGAVLQGLTAGTVILLKTRCYASSFSKLVFQIGTAHSGATHVYMGIYRSDGTQASDMATATVDALSTFGSTGVKTVTLTNSVSVAPGTDVYVAILVTGTPSVTPTLRCAGGVALVNGNLSSTQGFRSGASGVEQTSLPGSITLSGMSTLANVCWMGLQ